MFAIPSPDLLINLFASVGQAIGLFAILLGGTMFSRRGAAARLTSATPRSPWPMRVTVGLLVATALSFLMYHLEVIDQRNQRLRLNIVRATDFALKAVKDQDFKPMSLDAQMQHPLGVATEQIAQWLHEGKKLNLIDARESEEVELGHLPGAWHIRYPELLATEAGLVKDGQVTLIYCARGNRGAELVNQFTARGYKCQFMIGGTEKWLSEDREFVGLGGKDRTDIRDIPDYPKKNELLETAEVMAMVENEGAVFIDIRYPEEFKADHLPGAINLTYRRLRTSELEAALASIPHKPIIAPCYDERSSFFGMILGLQLTRRGYDFRGRYTLPHEYYIPKIPKAHVAKWRTEQEGKTPLGFVQGSAAGAFAWIQARLGSLAAAILALVLALRLIFFPLTVKAERDALAQKALAPRVEELRLRLAGDPGRINRAVMSLYRAARLTPVRNLVGVLLQLVVFLLAFLAVDAAAATTAEGFLWVKSLGAADATRVLPFLVAAIALAMMSWNATRRSPLRWVAWLGVSAALLAIVWNLAAAVNLYLALNMGLMVLQGRAMRAWRARSKTASSHVCKGSALGSSKGSVNPSSRSGVAAGPGNAIIPLAEACCSPLAGNKAARLARMKAEGFPVPDGFVVFPKATSPSVDLAAAESAWRALGGGKVAVRSSGVDEDGSGSSHAGEFETVLNVGRGTLLASIDAVSASLFSNAFGAGAGGSVVVQSMVDAECSGVMFTEDPSSTGCMLVESISGLCEELVGGRVTPRAHRFARSSHENLTKGAPPIDMGPLLELGVRAELLFGRPQDIEWAYAAGAFRILQSRDITSTSRNGRGSDAVRERERHRLLELAHGAAPDQVVFVQNEVSELLPRPTPFSLSFMDSLWASGGSTDLACRAMGIPYDVQEESSPFVVGVFGRLYVNRLEEGRRLSRSPGLLASFQLVRRGETLENTFRNEFLPMFSKEIRLREALDLRKLTEEELVAILREDRTRFVTRTYVQAEVINVTADVLLKGAADKLQRRGLDPAAMLSGMEETVVSRAYSVLGRGGEAGVQEFLQSFGHRANHDFELSEPRFIEDPASVKALAREIGAGMSETATASPAAGSGPDATKTRDAAAGLGRILGIAVDRARRFQVLKEEAKHHCLRELACLRGVVVEIGRRCGLGDDVFFLTPDEVERVFEPEFRAAARELTAERRRAREVFHDMDLPTELTIRDLEVLGIPGLAAVVVDGPGHSGLSSGTKVAGDHEVIGPVRIMRSPEDLDRFQDGEILVARFTDPSWLPVFRRARGIVTEVGGWLSHAAIQARERNITAIVGVKDALRSFATGDIVHLRTDGVIVKVVDRRRSPRKTVRQPARSEVGGVMAPLTVNDVSGTGISVTGLVAQLGQQVLIEYPEREARVPATVVRIEDGVHGLIFSGTRDEQPIQRPTAVA